METKKRALGRGLEQLFNNENLDIENFERTIVENANKDEIIEIDKANVAYTIMVNESTFVNCRAKTSFGFEVFKC